MLERRVHYRRQNHYATKSNKYKIVKTPGKPRSFPCPCSWTLTLRSFVYLLVECVSS